MRENPPALHVVYRSYGGENLKNRPAYYSKLLALLSLLRSVGRVEPAPEIVFVNDGPIPAERLAVMERFGEVLPIAGGSNRASYRRGLRLPRERHWAEQDLVWFAEDDYLYAPEALPLLVAGAEHLADADYFSLYQSPRLDSRSPRSAPVLASPPSGASSAPFWYRAASTTSTFGVRVGALREDQVLLRTAPYTGGAWDHASCLSVQGFRPYPWRDLAAEVRRPNLGARQRLRVAGRAAARAGLNLGAGRRMSRCRTMVCLSPNPITHMELPFVSDDAPWERLATETEQWGNQVGLGPSSAAAERRL